ncbi:hypothetical protein P153DRAFT_371720 [Dothidotthia symphoricarpi CBS 119687]|uniref:Uncharacterized protein n=1 Tax=Dothidotthia symphoricarpi CBS 119687 TaxID=1392245 RepID=A0A6A5ZUK8_9PLEO|nr:uncharacterized protein P153DRAFT_371720 [Dothidotthia symphoricarpi CBS 119687]KAF2123402.1 hypothetical protein P153DRAFT_371720 [Dothidotthia symphoricarpi CBS 119687]
MIPRLPIISHLSLLHPSSTLQTNRSAPAATSRIQTTSIMSDNGGTKTAKASVRQGWNDKELVLIHQLHTTHPHTNSPQLVCLLNVIEHSGVALDFKVHLSRSPNRRIHTLTRYQGAPYPPGRTASGFSQKIQALQKTLKPEFDAMKAGVPFEGAATAASTPKKNATPRKRKAKADEGGDAEGTPAKKRGRAKKADLVVESELEVEMDIKPEVVDEDGVDDEIF